MPLCIIFVFTAFMTKMLCVLICIVLYPVINDNYINVTNRKHFLLPSQYDRLSFFKCNEFIYIHTDSLKKRFSKSNMDRSDPLYKVMFIIIPYLLRQPSLRAWRAILVRLMDMTQNGKFWNTEKKCTKLSFIKKIFCFKVVCQYQCN